MIFENNISLLLFCYLLILIVLSFFKNKYIDSRKIQLFRSLFPSWRFFEDICYLPVLYYRTSFDGDKFSKWQKALPKLKRNWQSLLLNPQGNLLHAYNTLLQQLENDKEEVSEHNKENLISSTSYQLTNNLVSKIIREQNNENKKIFYQFKLTSTMQGNLQDSEDVLISITHEA